MAQSKAETIELVGPESSMAPVIIVSIIFHLIVFIIIPIATSLLSRPTVHAHAATFELVSLPHSRPTPKQTVAPEPQKIEQAKAQEPVPKTSKTKPVPKTAKTVEKAAPVEEPKDKTSNEDLSELNDLLGGISQPVSSMAFASNFPYSWYERNLSMKVERNWRPTVEDDKLAVVLTFTIHADGSISGLAIKKSSGNSMIDNQGMRAIQLAAPFGTLPPAYSSDHLDVEYTLRASRR